MRLNNIQAVTYSVVIFISLLFTYSYLSSLFLIFTIILLLINSKTNIIIKELSILLLFYIPIFQWYILLYQVNQNFKMVVLFKFILFIIISISVLNTKQILKEIFKSILFLGLILLLIRTSVVSIINGELTSLVNYIANTYIPLFMMLSIFYFKQHISHFKSLFYNSFIIALFILISLELYYLVIDFANNNDLTRLLNNLVFVARHGFEKHVELLGTAIGNIVFWRIPGINMDVVFSGYLWATIAYFLFLIKRYRFLIVILVLFILIAVSKGALIFLFYLIYFDYLVKRKLKYITIFSFVFFNLLLIIISFSTHTSGAVHVTGLIAPFTYPLDINYFIGYDFNGGNMSNLTTMSDKLYTGAESFIGILKYHLGLFGVMLFLYLNVKIIKENFRQNNIVSRYVAVMLISTLLVSFLQENVYNLSYIIIKLVVLYTIMSFYQIQRNKYANKNRK